MQERTLAATAPLPGMPVPEPQIGAPSVATYSTRVSAQTRRRAALAVAGGALSLDAAIIWLAFCAAYYLRYTVQWAPVELGTLWVPFSDWIPFGISFSLVELASLLIAGSY
ncbi:MAG: hypothetical protein ACRDGS_02525, partial [Chloroflexota bacterium]